MNDSLMVGIVLTLVFGAVIFYLYNRLSMTERKMGLFEGVLTDLKIMMDSAPYVSGPPSEGQQMNEFEPTPEYLNAISGPFPLKEEEVEDVQEEYKQAMEQAMEQPLEQPIKSLQIDELAGVPLTATNAINVTKLSPDLEAMSVKELKQLAKDKGLTVAEGARKKTLVDLLKVNGTSDATGFNDIQGTLLSSMDGPEPTGGAPLDSSSS
jgi:hypothetical protein